jgi:glucose/arabinose dehydrogenase
MRIIKISLLLWASILINACGGSGGNSPAPSPTPIASPSPTLPPLGFTDRPSNKTCFAGEAPQTPVRLQRIYSDVSLQQPLDMRQAPGSASSRFYIAEKGGRIVSLPADDQAGDAQAVTALQLDVFTEEEAGIAALAFHPNFQENGRAFVTYVAELPGQALELRLSEFTLGLDGVSLENEQILMQIPQDNPIHFGGDLAFGPDGYLYMSVGDDGDNSVDDHHSMLAQDTSNVYGSILRLDINNNDSPLAYRIPADNPEIDGLVTEVWAYGFRNPWRMSFDREPPYDLWSSNVGASFREEINLVEAGANYGWPFCEGACEPFDANYTDPIYSYRNSTGAAAIGGHVYRGNAIPALQGQYIFGGFVAQALWVLDPNLDQSNPLFVQTLINTPFSFADIAQDNAGELYVLGISNGAVYRLVESTNEGSEPAALLSQTGCFASIENGVAVPAEGLIAYDVAQSFWSDGAEKTRFFAIPDSATIDASDPSNWQLPPNSVTIKHFYWADNVFETRLLLRYEDGSYGGLTYAWNEDLSDAELVDYNGESRSLQDIDWHYPGRGDCLRCHTEAAGRTLSIHSAQLNLEHDYPSGIRANQIDTFAYAGLLNTTSPHKSRSFPTRTQLNNAEHSLNRRLSSYLQVNCANCHQSGNLAGRASWDASHGLALGSRALCDQRPFELTHADELEEERLLVPGRHDLSTLWIRTSTRGSSAMPPLGSAIVDQQGADLMQEWIESIQSCPLVGTEIPARIQAQDYARYFDYSQGNNGSSSQCDRGDNVDSDLTSDAGGQCLIGWIEDEEWLEYDIHALASGTFSIVLRLASGIPTDLPSREVSVWIDGVQVSDPIAVTAEGWTNFSDYRLEGIPIDAGNHRLRIFFDNGFVNFNYLEIE